MSLSAHVFPAFHSRLLAKSLTMKSLSMAGAVCVSLCSVPCASRIEKGPSNFQPILANVRAVAAIGPFTLFHSWPIAVLFLVTCPGPRLLLFSTRAPSTNGANPLSASVHHLRSVGKSGPLPSPRSVALEIAFQTIRWYCTAGASSAAAVGRPCASCNTVMDLPLPFGLIALAATFLRACTSESAKPQICAPYIAAAWTPVAKIFTARFPPMDPTRTLSRPFLIPAFFSLQPLLLDFFRLVPPAVWSTPNATAPSFIFSSTPSLLHRFLVTSLEDPATIVFASAILPLSASVTVILSSSCALASPSTTCSFSPSIVMSMSSRKTSSSISLGILWTKSSKALA